MRRLSVLPVVCVVTALIPAADFASADSWAAVPFVGCASDGQTDFIPRPSNRPTPRLPGAYAKRLAYYQAESGPGALAPRGWHCFGLYGSNGSGLIVTPERRGRELIVPHATIAGPVVQVWGLSSETSGRFEVSRVAARFFPVAKRFVEDVAAERLEDVSPEPLTAADRVTARTETHVEFITAAGQMGFATRGRIKPSSEPIRGAYVLEDEGLMSLLVRLRRQDADLAPIIIRNMVGRYDEPGAAERVRAMRWPPRG